MTIRTLYWQDDKVVMIDQKVLPQAERLVTCEEYGQVIDAIKDLTVRGAPAIGVAAAMGIALGILGTNTGTPAELKEAFDRICGEFSQARPTARNLFWAVERMRGCFDKAAAALPTEQKKGRPGPRPAKEKTTNQISLFDSLADNVDKPIVPEAPWELQVKRALIEEAVRICEEDIAINRKIGEHGKALVKDGYNILTHCNAGALATAGYGTALGVIRAAWEEGKKIHVYVDETRPVLQGARLTAWELMKEGIPATLVTDNMAGFLMKQGKIDMIIVGADRIAANGDAANKIGTYSLAVLARAHGIPIYFAAPLSTIDPATADGTGIVIEERQSCEVTTMGGVCTAPEGIAVYNPAFDVTPHELITAIITEAAVIEPPFDLKIKEICAS
ncbi:MAG: S-methyl-5-thioribose-1-phosphate isomerase [Syntrophales bacterium]|nr:S-methyl-5-thioribose-1-phosphate isomerase [Syntrophales bacterium]